MKKKHYYLLLLLSFSVLFLQSCSDDDNPSSSGAVPEITAVTPNQGAIGSQIIISGSGFSKTVSENKVSVSGVSASIDSVTTLSSPMKIYFRVPAGAVTGALKLTVNGKTAAYAEIFTVITNTGVEFPDTKDTYWTYKRRELDSMNIVLPEITAYDSVFVSGTESHLGKTASIFASYRKQEINDAYNQLGNQFYYTENSVVYSDSAWFDDLLNFGSTGMILPFAIENKWYKLMDPNSAEWEIFTKVFTNEPLSFGVLTGTLTIKGKNEGLTSVNAGGNNYVNARKYSVVLSFKGNILALGSTIPLDLERTVEFWYVPDIGKVKTQMKSMRFVVPNMINQLIPGFVTEISAYSIK